jgi:hypothetical protein
VNKKNRAAGRQKNFAPSTALVGPQWGGDAKFACLVAGYRHAIDTKPRDIFVDRRGALRYRDLSFTHFTRRA